MNKHTITIKLGRDVKHIAKDYDHAILLDEAEYEAIRILRETYIIGSFLLDYIGRWEWAIKIDDRVVGHILWTMKG